MDSENAQPLTPDELARVRKYIDRMSKPLPRCPMTDVGNEELMDLIKRYLEARKAGYV
jgi:hypothetical protein